MQAINLEQALAMAGVDRTDDDWVRDLKFTAWLQQVKGEVVTDPTDPVEPKTQIKIFKKENK